jgi:antitoxin component YwqK of YwqJK toxin-antitoxin module
MMESHSGQATVSLTPPQGSALGSRCATIADGKVNGTFRSWHNNGHLSEQIEMKLGKADGIAWAWYPSGFVKAETTVRDGQILSQKTWKDGERPGLNTRNRS